MGGDAGSNSQQESMAFGRWRSGNGARPQALKYTPAEHDGGVAKFPDDLFGLDRFLGMRCHVRKGVHSYFDTVGEPLSRRRDLPPFVLTKNRWTNFRGQGHLADRRDARPAATSADPQCGHTRIRKNEVIAHNRDSRRNRGN